MSRSYFGKGVDSKKPQARTYRDVDSRSTPLRGEKGIATSDTPHHEDIMDIMAEMSRAGTFHRAPL